MKYLVKIRLNNGRTPILEGRLYEVKAISPNDSALFELAPLDPTKRQQPLRAYFTPEEHFIQPTVDDIVKECELIFENLTGPIWPLKESGERIGKWTQYGKEKFRVYDINTTKDLIGNSRIHSFIASGSKETGVWHWCFREGTSTVWRGQDLRIKIPQTTEPEASQPQVSNPQTMFSPNEVLRYRYIIPSGRSRTVIGKLNEIHPLAEVNLEQASIDEKALYEIFGCFELPEYNSGEYESSLNTMFTRAALEKYKHADRIYPVYKSGDVVRMYSEPYSGLRSEKVEEIHITRDGRYNILVDRNPCLPSNMYLYYRGLWAEVIPEDTKVTRSFPDGEILRHTYTEPDGKSKMCIGKRNQLNVVSGSDENIEVASADEKVLYEIFGVLQLPGLGSAYWEELKRLFVSAAKHKYRTGDIIIPVYKDGNLVKMAEAELRITHPIDLSITERNGGILVDTCPTLPSYRYLYYGGIWATVLRREASEQETMPVYKRQEISSDIPVMGFDPALNKEIPASTGVSTLLPAGLAERLVTLGRQELNKPAGEMRRKRTKLIDLGYTSISCTEELRKKSNRT